MNQIQTLTPTTDADRRKAKRLDRDTSGRAVRAALQRPAVPRADGAPRALRRQRRAAVHLLSIKTGGCEEDCKYCPQSAHFDTGLKAEKLIPLAEVLEAAKAAKANGATRFCMGAAWRSPKDRHLTAIGEMIREVKAMGLETCLTAGMLNDGQAEQLREAGLDYYNHNLDTAPEFYGQIITTRTYQDRLDTLERVRNVGLKVCSGGIVGMGETRRQRAGLIVQLANLDPYPEIGAHQQPDPGRRHAAGRCRGAGPASNSSARSRWPASPCRARWCACRPAAKRCPKRCKACVSWPAPTACSTATSC
jgi:biotin synthase